MRGFATVPPWSLPGHSARPMPPSACGRGLSPLLLLSLLLCNAPPPAAALDNGLARTPPMGWCSWNAYGRRFNESVFYETADAMASNGMQAAGCALTPLRPCPCPCPCPCGVP